MKLFIAVMLLCLQARAAISLVNSTLCHPGNAVACTIPSTSAGSSLIFVVLLTSYLSPSPSIVTNQSQTAVAATGAYESSSASIGATDIQYIAVATTATTTTTAVSSGGSPDYVVYEVSGLNSSTPLNSANNLANQTPATAPSSPSIAIVAPQFLAAILAPDSACSGVHSGNPFTNDFIYLGVCWSHYIDTTGGSDFAQWDITSGRWGTSIAAFYGFVASTGKSRKIL